MMDAHHASLLLAVPVSDPEVIGRLSDLSDTSVSEALETWLASARSIGWMEADVSRNGRTLTAEVTAPLPGVLHFHVRPTVEEVQALTHRLSTTTTTDQSCHVLFDPDDGVDTVVPFIADVAVGVGGGGMLTISAEWAAAVVVEGMHPFLYSDQAAAETWNVADAPDVSPAYFSDDMDTDLSHIGVNVARASSRSRDIGALTLDTTLYEEKLRQIKQRQSAVEGTVLLATVFLPPVTHSQTAVERFYKTWFGIREEALPLITKRYNWERNQFRDHVSQYRRIDVIDRGVLQEYLLAPEYYQMLLTVDELQAQVTNVIQLLEFDNYTMCLCPESIDLSFELRNGQVRIRTDRRNKGQPRQGRLSSLTFENPSLADVFEREFWSLVRATEPPFKDKDYLKDWLLETASHYRGPEDID